MPDDILVVNGTELLVIDTTPEVLVAPVEAFVAIEIATQGPPGPPGPAGAAGPAGPAGPAGASGDLNFTFDQVAASATWVITHNLGKYPSVSVADTAGTAVEGSVVYASANQLTVSFASPFSGTAYLN